MILFYGYIVPKHGSAILITPKGQLFSTTIQLKSNLIWVNTYFDM